MTPALLIRQPTVACPASTQCKTPPSSGSFKLPVAVSQADPCRVKGKQFTIPHLLGAIDDDTAKGFTDVAGDNGTTATSQKQTARTPSDLKSEIAKNPKVTNNTKISDQKQDQALQAFLRHSDYALAVARLAPQDYHRFHSPVDGVLVSQTDIDGDLYSKLRGRLPLANQQL